MAHDQEVVGSNPSPVYWMDVSDDASYYIKEKLKIKVAEWGTPKFFFKQISKNIIFHTQTDLKLLFISHQ
jgi:hypothetical protein